MRETSTKHAKLPEVLYFLDQNSPLTITCATVHSKINKTLLRILHAILKKCNPHVLIEEIRYIFFLLYKLCCSLTQELIMKVLELSFSLSKQPEDKVQVAFLPCLLPLHRALEYRGTQ